MEGTYSPLAWAPLLCAADSAHSGRCPLSRQGGQADSERGLFSRARGAAAPSSTYTVLLFAFFCDSRKTRVAQCSLNYIFPKHRILRALKKKMRDVNRHVAVSLVDSCNKFGSSDNQISEEQQVFT